MLSGVELNLDGLVGPTHNYAGLAFGNLASQQHAHLVSSPKRAALQGLMKMKLLVDFGVPQAVMPPHDRPDVSFLCDRGFVGSDAQILEAAYTTDSRLFAAACSASAMWVANSATVSPSADTTDGCIHLTPANLSGELHRSIEARTTALMLHRIFADPDIFVHHSPLPAASSDEGAANHTRLCRDYDQSGVELFVYGRDDANPDGFRPKRYPPRQSRAAANAIAQIHGLDPIHTVFAQQHPDAIDLGVFHNDVIAVGDRNVFFYHEKAYIDAERVMYELAHAYEKICGNDLCLITVNERDVSLSEAVTTYLFNSQIVCAADGRTVLIAPQDCAEHSVVREYLEAIEAFDAIEFVNLRQSMSNGGGPACLRLRIAMTQAQLTAVHAGVMLDAALYAKLTNWVERHYRDELRSDDLRDPALLVESRAALDELTRILRLGSIYGFQR